MNTPETAVAARIIAPPGESFLIVDRVVDAPRARVFRLYAEPGHLARFWGPHGSVTRIEEMDFRPGGRLRMAIRFPGGGQVAMNCTYLEIAEPERIVFRHGVPDGAPDDPHADFVSTIDFTEEDGATRITVHVRFRSAPLRDNALGMGFARPLSESLERLEACLRDA